MKSTMQGNTNCSQCKTGFTCAFIAGETSCWCSDYPNIISIPSGDSDKTSRCYCPDCLQKLIQEQQNDKIAGEQTT